MNEGNSQKRSGLVAVLGRPNVGKSSLINALVGEKVSIVTHKAQTTRHRAVGVATGDTWQIGLVDTPGLHSNGKHSLNKVMNETARSSRSGVDAVLMVVEAPRWTEDDDRALAIARDAGVPVGLVVNKVDCVPDKNELLPYLQACAGRMDFAFTVPISAKRKQNLEALCTELTQQLPTCDFLYPEDEFTDRSLRFLAAETVREKLTLKLHEELPYNLAVTVDDWESSETGIGIAATIWVARSGHKAIVIGKGGAMLKEIGQRARLELASRLDCKVDLRLWVKIQKGWVDDETAVRGFDT